MPSAQRRIYIPGESPRTARGEARKRLAMQRECGPNGSGMEWAYSPSTGAVGMRWVDADPPQTFRVPNIHYPMFGLSEYVTDWVSVGAS